MNRDHQLSYLIVLIVSLLAMQPAAAAPTDNSWPFQLLPKPDNYTPPPKAQQTPLPVPTPRPVTQQPAEPPPPTDDSSPVTVPQTSLERLYVSADGLRLALMRERHIEIYDAASKKLLHNVGVNSVPRTLAFPSATRLLADGAHGGLNDWDLMNYTKTSNRILTNEPVGSNAKGMNAFDAVGNRLTIIGSKELGVYDVVNSRWLWQQPYTNPSGSSLVTMSPDGQWVAANFGEGKAGIYEATTGKLSLTITGFARNIAEFAFSSDSRTLATATQTHGIQLWDVATGKLLREIKYEIHKTWGGLIFSPDGRWLAVIEPSADVKKLPDSLRVAVINLATGELQREITTTAESGKTGAGLATTFSPDGRTLYTVGQNLESWPVD